MFVVSGRRPQDNLYLLNGIEYTGASLINVTPGGTSGQLLGVDAVREFNVVSDTYGANYGKRQGAQISIVTNSGTNTVHGSAYEFLRNSFFDGAQLLRPVAHSQLPAQQLRRLARRPVEEEQALPLRQLRGLPPEPWPLRRHLCSGCQCTERLPARSNDGSFHLCWGLGPELHRSSISGRLRMAPRLSIRIQASTQVLPRPSPIRPSIFVKTSARHVLTPTSQPTISSSAPTPWTTRPVRHRRRIP